MELVTKRLKITPFTEENFPVISKTYAAGRHITHYIDQLKSDPAFVGWGVWCVTRLEDGQVIGDIGFKGKPDQDGFVEVGYGLIPSMHNQGYATESVQAILDWALSSDKVKAVRAECLEDNVPSIRVLEKLGMQRVNVNHGMIQWELTKNRE